MSKINRNSNSDKSSKKSSSSYSGKKSDFKGRTSGGRSYNKSDDSDDKKKPFRTGGKSYSRDERSDRSGKSSYSKSSTSRSGSSSRSEGRSEGGSRGNSEGRFEEKRKSFGDKGAGAKRPFKKSFDESSSEKRPFKTSGRRSSESFDKGEGRNERRRPGSFDKKDSRTEGRRGPGSFDKKDSRSEGRRGPGSFDKKDSRSEGRRGPGSFDKKGARGEARSSSFSKEKPFKSSAERAKDKSDKIKKSFDEKKKSFKKQERDTDFSPKAFPKRTPSETTRKRTFKDLDKDVEYSTPPTYNIEPVKPKKGGKSSENKKPEGELIRLNKFISNSGVCSRRDADVLIQAGEVTVNGTVITELGFKVSRADVVKFNGQSLKAEKLVYVLLNKPKDFITTTDDPDERRTVMSLVKNACRERIYPVGRLDRQTTGLLLITNDGELAKKLTHPSHGIAKVYQADLDKPVTEEDLEKLSSGVTLEDGFAQFDTCAIVSDNKRSVGLEIHIGKNRIVRRMFEHLGYEVEKLDRVMYAGLTKKDLPRGQWRYLTEKEVIRLKHFIK